MRIKWLLLFFVLCVYMIILFFNFYFPLNQYKRKTARRAVFLLRAVGGLRKFFLFCAPFTLAFCRESVKIVWLNFNLFVR